MVSSGRPKQPVYMQDYGYTYFKTAPDYANRGYDRTFFDEAFNSLHGMGANTARLVVFFDGRSAPQFGGSPDPYNKVMGLERPLKQACVHCKAVLSVSIYIGYRGCNIAPLSCCSCTIAKTCG